MRKCKIILSADLFTTKQNLGKHSTVRSFKVHLFHDNENNATLGGPFACPQSRLCFLHNINKHSCKSLANWLSILDPLVHCILQNCKFLYVLRILSLIHDKTDALFFSFQLHAYLWHYIGYTQNSPSRAKPGVNFAFLIKWGEEFCGVI